MDYSVPALRSLAGVPWLPVRSLDLSQPPPRMVPSSTSSPPGSLGGFPKAALQIGGKGNLDWVPGQLLCDQASQGQRDV